MQATSYNGEESGYMSSFIRWAGSKRWIVDRIQDQLPPFNKYIEPFAGSAQMFFALKPERAIIGDMNDELIHAYSEIKRDAKPIVKLLRMLEWSQPHYYKVRNELFGRSRGSRRAAYFLFLNRLCWNGLYRVNGEGKFNVPYGHQDYSGAFIERFFSAVSAAQSSLRRCKLIHGDFANTCSLAKPGDLVFLDPPYVLGQGARAFREYTASSFSEMDELRLSKIARQLATRGVHVVLTHASTEHSKRLYAGYFYVTDLVRQETIAGDATKRKGVRESIFSTFEIRNIKRRGRSLQESVSRVLVS